MVRSVGLVPARGPDGRPDLLVVMPARKREHGLKTHAGAGRNASPEALREFVEPVVGPGPPDPVPPLVLEGVQQHDPPAPPGAVRGEERRLGELTRTEVHGELHPEPGDDRAEVLLPVTGEAGVGVRNRLAEAERHRRRGGGREALFLDRAPGR